MTHEMLEWDATDNTSYHATGRNGDRYTIRRRPDGLWQWDVIWDDRIRRSGGVDMGYADSPIRAMMAANQFARGLSSAPLTPTTDRRLADRQPIGMLLASAAAMTALVCAVAYWSH